MSISIALVGLSLETLARRGSVLKCEQNLVLVSGFCRRRYFGRMDYGAVMDVTNAVALGFAE